MPKFNYNIYKHFLMSVRLYPGGKEYNPAYNFSSTAIASELYYPSLNTILRAV
jgi:hypothetical protein